MTSKVGMARDYLRFLILAELCGFYTFSATAAISIFSDYGQIQNVQNYSTNPFWSPNSPYNQRLPQPVYVQGADLKAADCISVVKSMVSAQCMTRDNCKNTVLSDIRPTIMVQLANLPGANYVSACSGYLDYIFDTYKQQNGNTLSNRKISFPAETTPNPDINNTNGVQLKNPYKSQPPKWLQDIKGRADELKELQKQNGSDDYALSAKTFPKTYEDLSFTERMENDRAGLMPYKDLKAYYTLDIENITEYCEDDTHKKTEACIKYANDKKEKDQEKPVIKKPEDKKQPVDDNKKPEDKKQPADDNKKPKKDDDSKPKDPSDSLKTKGPDPVEIPDPVCVMKPIRNDLNTRFKEFCNFELPKTPVDNFNEYGKFTALWRTSKDNGYMLTNVDSNSSETMVAYFIHHLDEATSVSIDRVGHWAVAIHGIDKEYLKLFANGESSCSEYSHIQPDEAYQTSGNVCWCRVSEMRYCENDSSCKDSNEMLVDYHLTEWVPVTGRWVAFEPSESCATRCAKECVIYFLSGQKGLFYYPLGS